MPEDGNQQEPERGRGINWVAVGAIAAIVAAVVALAVDALAGGGSNPQASPPGNVGVSTPPGSPLPSPSVPRVYSLDQIPSPCSALNASILAEYKLNPETHFKKNPANGAEDCGWLPESGTMYIVIGYYIHANPQASDPVGWTAVPIAGHPDAIMSNNYPQSGTCKIEWRTSFGDLLIASTNTGEDAQCSRLQQFAATVAPGLPG